MPDWFGRQADHSEELLHDRDVEPAVELASDLALDADQLEAARRMEPARRRPAGLDPGEDGVEAGQLGDASSERPDLSAAAEMAASEQ